MPDAPDIYELAEKLTGALPRLDPREQRVALALIGQLALAAPVSSDRLAGEAGLPEVQVADALERAFPGSFATIDSASSGSWA